MEDTMGCFRILFCIVFPPLAVIDRGCAAIIIVTILTITGWVPGVIAALVLNFLAEAIDD
jgi:uncharacterized membrane protein YqaE (UPF0057 family)